jgi:uracil-DNA glycosylase
MIVFVSVGPGTRHRKRTMPSLFRLLTILAIIAALIYVGMVALTSYVKLDPREITVTVPQHKFVKQR